MMATHAELHWLDVIAEGVPRFIESEGKWCVAYTNESGREIERFASREEALQCCEELSATATTPDRSL